MTQKNEWWQTFFDQQYISDFEAEETFAHTDEYTDEIIALTKLKKNARVLDVPCGFGRYASAFHKRGYRVDAIDIVKSQLEVAEKKYPGPTYIQADMRDPLTSNYELVICMLSSFGYFLDQDEDIKPLEVWYNALSKGGSLIMELRPLESFVYHFREFIDGHGSENDVYKVDWDNSIIRIDFGNGRIFTNKYYSVSAFKYFLKKIGFSDVHMYEDLKGTPYSAKSRWLIIHAIK